MVRDFIIAQAKPFVIKFHKMVKHTQTIRRQFPFYDVKHFYFKTTFCFSVEAFTNYTSSDDLLAHTMVNISILQKYS